MKNELGKSIVKTKERLQAIGKAKAIIRRIKEQTKNK